MGLELVRAKVEMAEELGRIFFEAFDQFHKGHRVPVDIPSVAVGIEGMKMFTGRPDYYGVAAVLDGKIVGSNFVSLTDATAGVGPITVDPAVQARGVGRMLMQHIVDYARKQHGPQVRLVQDAVNTTSVSLYSSIGFDLMEPLFLVEQRPADAADPTVRVATEKDVPAADAMLQRIYRVSRVNEFRMAVQTGAAMGMAPHVRERNGKMVAAVIPGFFGFGVAETNEDLLATVTTAARQAGPFTKRWLLPARNTALYRAVLQSGARLARMCNLMAMGPYESPAGAWFPSIAY
jgi:GNAT superfamily N-acetyltransferase